MTQPTGKSGHDQKMPADSQVVPEADQVVLDDGQIVPGEVDLGEERLVRADDQVAAADNPAVRGEDEVALDADTRPAPRSHAAAGAAGGANSGERWHEIQATFVDNPRASVEQAAGLLHDSVEELVVSVKERQHELLSAWRGNDAGTEELRTALQGYRTLWHRLEDFSRRY